MFHWKKRKKMESTETGKREVTENKYINIYKQNHIYIFALFFF